jgi:type II secretory pathway predicted ATPase ExeA
VIQTCPHLGVPGDREVRYGYPNILNVCYTAQAVWSEFEPVELAHQRQFCLTQDHLLCPIYLRQAAAVERRGHRGRAPTFLEFFGLHEEPFSIVPQPRYLCESQSQQEAHQGLRWLIDRRQGLGLLFGPVGTGKTLLCQTLFQELSSDPQYAAALLLTPSQRSEYALMADVLDCWKAKTQRRRSLRDLETAAHHFLLRTVLGRRKTAVLIVDEAQTLSVRLLHQVCKLLNWQDEGQQLLQVILAGQPSLQGKLRRVPALRDRAVIECTLTAMTPADVRMMITERLRRAGRQADLFTPGAVQLIQQQAGGMPRRVTILCLLSMWRAYQDGKRTISADVALAAIERAGHGGLFGLPDGEAAQLAARPPAAAAQPPPARVPRLLQRLWARVTT